MCREKQEIEAVYCTINEAAERSGISRCAIRNWCKNGTIPCLRFGTGQNAVYKVHYQKFLERLEQAAVNGGDCR